MSTLLMERNDSPGTEQATEEEQAAYEYLSTQALDFIHDDKSANFVKNTIGQAKDPLDGIAKVTAVILKRLDVQNKENGGVPDEVKLEVAEDIINELLALAISSGVVDEQSFTQNEEKNIEAIVKSTYQYYMEQEEQAGTLDPEQEKQNVVDAASSQEAKQGIGAMSNEAASQLNKMFGA